MADIEEAFLNRDRKDKSAFKAPPFIPRRVLKDLGTEKLKGDRYFSREFMQQEWEKVWKKTWHFVMKASELDQAGAFYTHELGKESFLFVRGSDDEIRGFYNVCRHRGNRLCQVEEGVVDTFTCPYHGWKWNDDGSLKQVADPHFFKQFDEGIPEDELGLVPIKVDVWEGWLWFNMDSESCPLREYLGPIGEHLETYYFEDCTVLEYQSFECYANW